MDSVARCQVVVWHTEEGETKKKKSRSSGEERKDDFTEILLRKNRRYGYSLTLVYIGKKKMVEKTEMNGITDIFQDVLVLFEEVSS